MGSCQNRGPFLGTLNIWCRTILGTPKGTKILRTKYQGVEVIQKTPDLPPPARGSILLKSPNKHQQFAGGLHSSERVQLLQGVMILSTLHLEEGSLKSKYWLFRLLWYPNSRIPIRSMIYDLNLALGPRRSSCSTREREDSLDIFFSG